jgi:hypothetical protein
VDADELQKPFHRLQNGHVDVEVHPVDPLKFRGTRSRNTSATLCDVPGLNFSAGLPRIALL